MADEQGSLNIMAFSNSRHRDLAQRPWYRKSGFQWLSHPVVRTGLTLLTIALAVWVFILNSAPQQHSSSEISTNSTLHVSGNHLVNSAGQTVTLRGVTRWSLEFNCRGDGHFQPSDFAAMQSWGINAVRITLNSQFWLHGYGNNCTADNYHDLVATAVANAEAANLFPILVLQWTGNQLNGGRGGQMGMPPRDALDFWHQVASVYASHPSVMYSLFAEPHDPPSWDVWLRGDGQSAGMQEMADRVEGASPGHVIFVSGSGWAKDLSFVTNGHMVRGTNIVLEVHPYNYYSNFLPQWTALQAHYPIVDGEVGIDDQGDTVDQQLPTFENWKVGYFGWAWTDNDDRSLLMPNGWSGVPRDDGSQFGIRFYRFLQGHVAPSG